MRMNKGVTQNADYVKLREKSGSRLETRMIWNSKRWVYEWALRGKNHRNSALELAGKLGNSGEPETALESAVRLGNGSGTQS